MEVEKKISADPENLEKKPLFMDSSFTDSTQPEPMEEEKHDEKEPPPLRCRACEKEIKEEDRACRFCGQYIPKPGETFDLSKVNFTLPQTLAARYKPTKKAENQHDMPFPIAPGEDVTKSHAGNEWILNHLPLQEHEKEESIKIFREQFLKKKREERILQRSGARDKEREEFAEKAKQKRWQERQKARRLLGLQETSEKRMRAFVKSVS